MNRKVRNIILRLSLIFFFGGFFVLVVFAKANRETRVAEKLVVHVDQKDGLFFLDKSQVVEMLTERFDTDQKIDLLKLEKIEKFLERIPHVSNAEAYVDNNNQLNISIYQRKPVARVLAANGINFYVDANGIKFPLSPNYTAKVPLITGVIPEKSSKVDSVRSSVVKDALSVIHFVSDKPFWAAQIAQLNINEMKEIECIPRMGSHIIQLGDNKTLEDKFRRLDIFYSEVLNRTGWDTFKIISVQYKNQIICK